MANRNALRHGCYSHAVLEFRHAMRELLSESAEKLQPANKHYASVELDALKLAHKASIDKSHKTLTHNLRKRRYG